jgi:prevent-host-death family protein
LSTWIYYLHMKTLPVGELKTHFSEVLSDVKAGEEVVITYGKKKENIAVLIPYAKYKKKNSIRLGLLNDKKMKMRGDFEMSEEELISL